MTDEQIQKLDAWAVYLEIRKAKNRMAPFTPGAEKRILAKLRMLSADGQSVEEVLWNSVEHGWTSVYAVQRKGWQGPAMPHPTPGITESQRYLAEQQAHREEVAAQRARRQKA